MVQDQFVTGSGRQVDLRIYVEEHNLVGPPNRPISVYRLGGMPIQSSG